MPQTTAIVETADFYRADTSSRLDPKRRAALGQYMTAVPLARFLASLFDRLNEDICSLDPGMAVGSLAAAFLERMCHQPEKPRSATLICYEIGPLMIDYLQSTPQTQSGNVRAHRSKPLRMSTKRISSSRKPNIPKRICSIREVSMIANPLM